jgi:phosphatidylglycerophosphate synthase
VTSASFARRAVSVEALDARAGGTGSPRAFRANLEALQAAQKSGAGVPAYTRWVNRRLARPVAALAHTLGLTPNAVTVVSATVSAAALAALLLLPAAPLTGLLVAALLAAGYLLDSADGQVARLSGTSSIAGEWLDHVVDAIRTPAIHLAVLAALIARDGAGTSLYVLPILFAVLAAGQFMSQILAEQLGGREAAKVEGTGVKQSLVLLPTDTGVLCWLFVLWGFLPLFAIGYGALLALNLLHGAVSMRRKYSRLQRVERERAAG